MHWIYAGVAILAVWGTVSLFFGLRITYDAVQAAERELELWTND